MAQTQAQKNASKKYHTKLDDIRIRVPKGEKSIIQDYAKSKGLSLNAYITKLIDDDMKNE